MAENPASWKDLEHYIEQALWNYYVKGELVSYVVSKVRENLLANNLLINVSQNNARLYMLMRDTILKFEEDKSSGAIGNSLEFILAEALRASGFVPEGR